MCIKCLELNLKKKSNSITSLTFDQIVARKKGNSLSLAVLKTVIFHHVVTAYSCIGTTGSVVEIPVVSEAVVVIGGPTEILTHSYQDMRKFLNISANNSPSVLILKRLKI